MTRWLITGGGGMLAVDLRDRLLARGADLRVARRADLDVRDADAVRRAVRAVAPDVLVNCAGWTAVDDAESQEEEALAVNGLAVRHLAAECAATGARLIHISTDYVFDGTAREPYPEDAPTAPVSAYGRTKLAGELAVRELLPDTGYIVRTAWLYGAHGPNFVRTMMRLAREHEKVHVVDDQVGQPTWTGDLADQIIMLGLSTAPPGVYHGTSSGATSWYGLAGEIFTLLGLDSDRVRPVSSTAFPRPAVRPAYCVLGHGRWAATGLPPIRDWRAALRAAWPALTAPASAGAP
jgi:dTDP-4-dehydrorhamnose reductase